MKSSPTGKRVTRTSKLKPPASRQALPKGTFARVRKILAGQAGDPKTLPKGQEARVRKILSGPGWYDQDSEQRIVTVRRLLAELKGNRSEAARQLGIARPTLVLFCQRHFAELKLDDRSRCPHCRGLLDVPTAKACLNTEVAPAESVAVYPEGVQAVTVLDMLDNLVGTSPEQLTPEDMVLHPEIDVGVYDDSPSEQSEVVFLAEDPAAV